MGTSRFLGVPLCFCLLSPASASRFLVRLGDLSSFSGTRSFLCLCAALFVVFGYILLVSGLSILFSLPFLLWAHRFTSPLRASRLLRFWVRFCKHCICVFSCLHRFLIRAAARCTPAHRSQDLAPRYPHVFRFVFSRYLVSSHHFLSFVFCAAFLHSAVHRSGIVSFLMDQIVSFLLITPHIVVCDAFSPLVSSSFASSIVAVCISSSFSFSFLCVVSAASFLRHLRSRTFDHSSFICVCLVVFGDS